ncbi:MAG TPA: type II CAAX endopeptidase family protein [Candidatus Saccharimonadales bacterium]|nr:type II CAAX endopeptidase family protein [Candidatus Saccharimonadales bacterium]
MPLERLDRNDTKVLLIWVLAGILGASVAYTFFFRAFPEASVEFKVPRAEALSAARQFAVAQGAQLYGYDSSIVFDLDDTAKTYLEREVGLQQANQIMQNQVHIWYWQTRFFRPLQKEEFDVRVDPAGGIVGYNHELEEAAPGARLERAQAQAIAESFLGDVLHIELSQYDFREQEANLTERPARRDWSFSWERRGFRAKDAPYRLVVTLTGDRVSGYNEFLKVPEAWTRDYDHLRSSNNTLEFIALIPYAFLIGGCLYVIIYLGRRDLLDWRAGLALGAFLTILFFIMTMNQWPLDRAAYDTNTPYSSFFLSQAGKAALTSIFSALLVVLAIVPGEPMYRILQPSKIRLNVGFSLPGIRTKEFFIANVIGICLAGAHIGYITIFYIISKRFGAWAPQDLNYENVVSTYVPWVYPLTIGIYAATSEEFLFRLFAIPFLSRVTKSRFLAVVLPAFFWGFLHSNYPQEPAYIRGLEVGLIGIVVGLVMLRWGIWATLIWHYTVDAFLISTSLMRSHGVYLPISGAIVGGAALIPLAIAAISYVSRGGFETDPSLLNRAQPLGGPPVEVPESQISDETETVTVEPVVPPTATSIYAGMSARSLTVLIVGGILGVALLAGIKREAIGDFVRFQIDSREAAGRADEVLRGIHVDPNTFHQATTVAYTFDDYTNEYLRRTIGLSAANRVYRDQVPSAFWTVRYFRNSQKEEYFVVMKPDGSLHSVHHTLDEKAPGANLTKEEAQARAEVYLRDQKGMNLADWNLVETHTDKKIARTDHTFEWEQKAALDSAAGARGAHIRVTLVVQGDEVSGYRIFIKIPQSWRDTESRSTPGQMAQSFGLAATIGLAFITILVVFLRNLKSPDVARVPWRALGKMSTLMLIAGIVIYINRVPQLLLNYDTTSPLIIYSLTLSISLAFAAAIYLAGAVLLLGLSWFFLGRTFGREFTPGWRKLNSVYFRDAFCVALFGSAAVIGLNRLPLLLARWPLLRHSLGASVPDNLDQLSPALGAFASSIAAAFVMVGFIGLAAGLIAAYLRPAWMRAALLVLVAVLMTTNIASPAAFFREIFVHLATVLVLWFGVTRLVRFNVLGYFLLAAMLSLVPSAIELLQQPNSQFHANGYAVVAFALAILAWPLMRWRQSTQA